VHILSQTKIIHIQNKLSKFAKKKKKKTQKWQPRQFDDTGALGLRVVSATKDRQYSTHGWRRRMISRSLSLSDWVWARDREERSSKWRWRLLGKQVGFFGIWFCGSRPLIDSDQFSKDSKYSFQTIYNNLQKVTF
jgi:hypothetical protein